MFNLEEELSPSTIQNQELLLEFKRHRVVTRLDEKIPRIVHDRMLIHPLAEILEELLED